MEGKLITDVEIIKFDGYNKEEIINRLSIKKFINRYFQKKDVYFIIPKDNMDDWFILNENLFKEKILISQVAQW